MENLIVLPTLAKKNGSGFNRYAEDATIISEETTKVQKKNHFIEANTMEIDLQHLKSDCISKAESPKRFISLQTNS